MERALWSLWLRPRAAGAAKLRELYGRAVRGDGAIPAAGAAARRRSEQLGMGQPLGGPHWKSRPAPSGHTGASRAPGDSGKSSAKFSETGPKVFLPRVCEALCVRACACFPLSEPPHAFSELFQLAASASGPDWGGCLRGPFCPAPPPPHPLRPFGFSKLLQLPAGSPWRGRWGK